MSSQVIQRMFGRRAGSASARAPGPAANSEPATPPRNQARFSTPVLMARIPLPLPLARDPPARWTQRLSHQGRRGNALAPEGQGRGQNDHAFTPASAEFLFPDAA